MNSPFGFPRAPIDKCHILTLLSLACDKCKHRSSNSETIGSPEDALEKEEQRHASVGSQDDLFDIQQQIYPKTLDFPATILPDLELVDGQPPCEDIPLDKRPEEDIFVENELFNDDTMLFDRMTLDSELSLIPSSANFDPELPNWENTSFCSSIPSLFSLSSSGVLRHEEMWAFCDGTLTHCLEMTRTEKMVDCDPLDSAVPLQAILWGWHTIDTKTRNHPAWIASREVDEKIFGLWKSKPQKIALMYVCSLVMLVCLYFLVQA